MDDSAVFYENKKRKALIKSKFEINKKTCRICLEEDEEKTSIINPIVAACLCKGSSGDIHVKCL
jgi:E3 ubiquitin-protein ligase DOA10